MPFTTLPAARSLAPVVLAALVLAACGPSGDPPRVEHEAPTVDAPTPDDPAADDPAADDPADGDPALDQAEGDDPGADEPEASLEPPTDDPPNLDVAVALTPVVRMDSPIAGDVGPDGVLHLAERAGTVHRLEDGVLSGAVVDLSSDTTTDSERGLLGIAFAADGSELYLSYTDREGASRIDAVTVSDGLVDGGERRSVFRLDQPFGNHNGGDLHVGPDGLLYLGLGDGGGGGDPLEAGQDLSTPLGALLRIDPQGADPYGIPADNPFVDVDQAAAEIVAYGLRNPWRFAFDPVTDEVWIADVGQSAREEINRVGFDALFGANFGWHLMEGSLEFAGSEPDDHVPPVYEYDTNGPEGCAVTGGVIYRGTAIPELVGAYLYADFCNGVVRGLDVTDAGEVRDQADLGVDGGSVVAFVADADGEVLVLDLGGAVHRLVPG